MKGPQGTAPQARGALHGGCGHGGRSVAELVLEFRLCLHIPSQNEVRNAGIDEQMRQAEFRRSNDAWTLDVLE